MHSLCSDICRHLNPVTSVHTLMNTNKTIISPTFCSSSDHSPCFRRLPLNHRRLLFLPFHVPQCSHIPIENPVSILWTSLGLWMELHGSNGTSVMTDSLIGTIIDISPGFCPALGKSGSVDCITVVLRGNVTTTG